MHQTVMSRYVIATLFSSVTLFAIPASGQDTWEGYLCCNYRYDRSWMSDSNYTGRPLMPVGTPVRIEGYGRYRVHTEMDGKKISIGNDYSRALTNEAFAKRIVTRDDPRPRIASFPPRIQDAIRAAQITPGMTKEQVLMSIGYPIASENPTLDRPMWRYWLGSFDEFQVVWNEKGVVDKVEGSPMVLNRVLLK